MRLGKRLFAFRLNLTEPISFKAHGGILYHLPNTKENLGQELFINGIYEHDIVSFLQKQIPDGALYFDIGANIGSLGLPIIKVKPKIRYYGFEASPMVFNYLKKNFQDNQIIHYELYNTLVHKDDNQKLKFYQSELYGKSSLSPTYSREYIEVESICLDSFCLKSNIESIDWMKVDVQGFEVFVFEGMKDMLRKKKVKNILFEFERWAEEAAELKAGTAMEYMRSMDYDLFYINGKPWGTGGPKNNTMIWARPKHSH